jgi:hypothetical protein
MCVSIVSNQLFFVRPRGTFLPPKGGSAFASATQNTQKVATYVPSIASRFAAKTQQCHDKTRSGADAASHRRGQCRVGTRNQPAHESADYGHSRLAQYDAESQPPR